MSELPTFRAWLLPPVILAITAACMVALHLWIPVAELWVGTVRLLGAVPALTGVLLAIWAERGFVHAQTPVIPGRAPVSLVRSGPYRFTRNPMYLGMVLVLVGLAVGLGTASPWAGPVAFGVIITRRFIRREEALLRAAFGDSYDSLCAAVRRWI